MYTIQLCDVQELRQFPHSTWSPLQRDTDKWWSSDTAGVTVIICHPGRERFWGPGMARDIENWCKQCPRCLRRKATGTTAPLVNIVTSQPLELVCFRWDIIRWIPAHVSYHGPLYEVRSGNCYQESDSKDYSSFVVHYGIPKRLHSDQWANFESKVIKQLCQIAGIEKSRTSIYHPMTERFNRTLLSMLGTWEPDKKAHWHKYVAPLVHAYCTRHESTGYAPYFLMFGHHPRLPVDVTFGVNRNANSPRQRQRKEHSNGRRLVMTLSTRSCVRAWWRALAFEGKHKLPNKWNEEIYVAKSLQSTFSTMRLT